MFAHRKVRVINREITCTSPNKRKKHQLVIHHREEGKEEEGSVVYIKKCFVKWKIKVKEFKAGTNMMGY